MSKACSRIAMTAGERKIHRTRRELHFGERVVRCFIHRPRSLHDSLAEAVARNPDGEALVCDDERLTWRDLLKASARLAGGLSKCGIRPGDRVAVLLGNRSEWILTLFAVTRLGAIFVPLNIREQKPELEYALNDCGAVLIIHEAGLASRLPASNEVRALRHRISIGRTRGSETIDVLLDDRAIVHPPAPVGEEDTAVILYTSGTTGRPKGAMLCHMNIVHSALHYELTMNLSKRDRSIVAVPLSHVTGFVAHVASMVRCAGTLILMKEFKAPDFIALALRERITHTLLVPAMCNLCLLEPDFKRLRASSWRIVGYGGAAMPPATIVKMSKLLPKLTLMNCYGATETSSPATIMPKGMTSLHPESVGQPVACAELMVIDDQGSELPSGEVGEICIGGPMVVKGYWNNPTATSAAFTGAFWHSGDLGSIDADGFVYVSDRKKDLINRGGFKVYAAEVEHVLLNFPGVLECAVVSKPCPVLGERVHAFVTLQDRKTTIPLLHAFCAERLSDYKVPESFTLLDSPLPRTASGKVLKRALRDELLARVATS